VVEKGHEPPHIRALLSLCESLDLKSSPEHETTLAQLSTLYRLTRYPPRAMSVPREEQASLARDLVRRTEEVLAWLDSLILQFGLAYEER